MGIGGWMPLEKLWMKGKFLIVLVQDSWQDCSLQFGNFLFSLSKTFKDVLIHMLKMNPWPGPKNTSEIISVILMLVLWHVDSDAL